MRRRNNMLPLGVLGFFFGVLFACLVPIRVILLVAIFVVIVCFCCHR